MKKITALLLALILCLALASCSPSSLKAEILNDNLDSDCLNSTALGQHRTHTIEGCVISPDPFTVIIKTEEEFYSIFTDPPEDISVDLTKETLIIYAFTTEYHREIIIESISEENGALTVEYKMKSPTGFFGVGDAAMPFERFVAVKVNSKNIDSAVFVEVD